LLVVVVVADTQIQDLLDLVVLVVVATLDTIHQKMALMEPSAQVAEVVEPQVMDP
jgi:hypothetical protein|tara:strand:+ start:200 stop:364 length:165 start_codon:yes stop_codon:yes gene_type:complete